MGDVVLRRSFRFPIGRYTAQLFKVVHHLVMAFLLSLGRFFLVLIMNVAEGVGSLQRLGRGVNAQVGSINETGWRAWTGIIDWPGILFGL